LTIEDLRLTIEKLQRQHLLLQSHLLKLASIFGRFAGARCSLILPFFVYHSAFFIEGLNADC